jgi:hypothetical protein
VNSSPDMGLVLMSGLQSEQMRKCYSFYNADVASQPRCKRHRNLNRPFGRSRLHPSGGGLGDVHPL